MKPEMKTKLPSPYYTCRLPSLAYYDRAKLLNSS